MNHSSISLDVHLESEIEPTLKFNPPHVGFLLACVEEVLEVCVSFRDIIGIDTLNFIMVFQRNPVFTTVTFVFEYLDD